MLTGFHPLVAGWFTRRFGTPTEPQALGWPAIQAGRDVLLSAPTGSGKTFAAFLHGLDALLREALAGGLPDETRIVYVSPLKALSNDIEKNLREPLAALREAAADAGLAMPSIRAGVRTGDTPASRRAAMLKRPPHVLVTTPESLYLLLTSDRGRRSLASVREVIVDEIHAVARDKRGAHLALSLERLDAVATRRPQRIGLSATVSPVEEMARFLVGTGRVGPSGTPDCAVVEVGRVRELDLAIEIPRDELSSVASNEQWTETYDRLAELVREHRTTLVFVNTRRLAERASHALAERLGAEAVAAHHGSLSRARRLDAEERLKGGALRAVVATASLELGIDIGTVDLVVQLGIAPLVRTWHCSGSGRSGHWRGATPRARLFPMSRDELVECAALVRGLRRARLERTLPPRHPLDVLAQQLVAEAASQADGSTRIELFALVRGAWPYRDLPRADFDAVVTMLSEGVATRSGVAQRRSSTATGSTAASAAGAGPASPRSPAPAPSRTPLSTRWSPSPRGPWSGMLDEDFAVESLAGDVFLLGNTSWRIRRIEAGVVRVEDARGAPPGLPFWLGEAPGRSAELSAEVGSLRAEIERRLPRPGRRHRLARRRGARCREAGARQAVDYLAAGRAGAGRAPHAGHARRRALLRRGRRHAGRRARPVRRPRQPGHGPGAPQALLPHLRLRAAGRRHRRRASCSRSGRSTASRSSRSSASSPRSASRRCSTQAALQSPMFPVRWRWDATRALALPRMLGGRRVPPNIARMRADDLLAAVFPLAGGLPGQRRPARRPGRAARPPARERGRCATAYRGDGPRRAPRACSAASPAPRSASSPATSPSRRRSRTRSWAPAPGPTSTTRPSRSGGRAPWPCAARCRPTRPRASERSTPRRCASWPSRPGQRSASADELHDLLLDVGFLPAAEGEAWRGVPPRSSSPPAAPRAARLAGREAWVAAERAGAWRVLAGGLGHARSALEPRLDPLPGEDRPRLARRGGARALRGWMPRLGPVTARGPGGAAGPSRRALVEVGLHRLESEGLVLRGAFLAGEPFSRRGAPLVRAQPARPHPPPDPRAPAPGDRAGLRRGPRPLLPPLAARRARARGSTASAGVAEVVGQLQGFHAAAGAWERGDPPGPGRRLRARRSSTSSASRARWPGEGSLVAPRPGRPASAARGPDAARAHHAGAPDRPAVAPRVAGGRRRPALGAAARRLVGVLERCGACFLPDLAAMTGPAPRGGGAGAVGARLGGARDLRRLRRAALARRPSAPARPAPAGPRRRPLGPLAPPSRPRRRRERRGLPRHRPRRPRWRSRRGSSSAAGASSCGTSSAREPGSPPWRELLARLPRHGGAGELRGGRFVAGFSGEQFALPEAVEALRAVRRASPGTGSGWSSPRPTR